MDKTIFLRIGIEDLSQLWKPRKIALMPQHLIQDTFAYKNNQR